MREIMTGQERVLAVLRRSEPDCVPTFEWDIDIGLIAKMTGGSYEDFVEALDLDAIMCSPNYGEIPAGNRSHSRRMGDHPSQGSRRLRDAGGRILSHQRLG